MSAPPVVGQSAAIRFALEVAGRFAPTKVPILLVGPTGTGKDLLARYIHECSGRAGPFVDVNCGALPRDMAESLLFGHKKGAFTGAVASHDGYLECAHGGTLFLDEMLDLPPEVQVKLLRVVETEAVQRLGATEQRRIDLRIVAAVQEDVVDRVDRGAFRRDLYRRVAGVVIDLPSLAERREDIVPLAAYFASLTHRVLEPDAERALLGHPWHENVRELRQVIERAGYLAENGTIGAGVLRDALALGAPRPRASAAPDAAAEHLLRTCAAQGWHAGRIARAMAISRNTLRARLRELGVSLRERKKYLWRRIGQTNVDQSCAIAWDARDNWRS